MKRWILCAAVFVLMAAAIYIGLSFLVPGWRLKLAAPPFQYAAASLRYGAGLKLAVALPLGVVAGAVPFIKAKR